MDVQKKLDDIVGTVGGARSMPMSASCVVNRADLLAMLEEVRQALPGSLAQAQELIGGREQMVEQAHAEAERIIEGARAERGTLIADTEIARRAQAEADRILAEARQEAEEVRAEADDYVDSKLANFEVVLNKTLGSVGRGREKLLGTGPGVDEAGYEDEDAPERSHDPETLRRDADAYVDTKLGAFEAVLAKTLEAVGKGRQKLHGRIASDDLGTLAVDGEGQAHTSDADYLAGLAEIGGAQAQQPAAAQPPQMPQPPQVPQIPSQAPEPAPVYAQQGQDPYGGYQQPYGQQDAYGTYQQDPYAAYQQDPYAYQQQHQQQDPYAYQQHQQDPQQQQPQAQDGALDETSLFDTSMISLEQMRQYEQGR
ncbi:MULTISPECIES: cell division initiation protein [unclassified Streptomyces]|uniref:ATP synthase F0 subunit B n=1 Tax=unclassified Streptomyces TaxID=2593676 RepID=UPI003BB60599